MANQSVLELAVGTGKWDAGLRKAQKTLNDFVEAQGGLDKALDKDNKDIAQFVKMMGDMSSTANTAKGQMNDYKRTLEQLSFAYSQMSDAQKQAVGAEFQQSIESIKQKFMQAKEGVEQFKQSLDGVSATEGGQGGGLFGGDKLSGMLQVFGGNLMTKAFDMATSAAMNFVTTIKDAAVQGLEMAKAGEGIRIAFERLNRPDLLDKLREATHGTVTDLELMKQAVKFNDFRLNLDQMGTLLAFAQQKAKDTGQSVDYMVDSIVTGLGRQSLMILDNLGLSASEIKERMKETGDMTTAVASIIKDQMSKAGDYVETAADRAAQADVELKNAMEDLGRTLMPLEEEGDKMWKALETGAIKLLNDGIKPLIPSIISLKNTIVDIATSVGNSSVFDGYISALGTVADKALQAAGPLGKVYMLLKMIKGSGGEGDLGAGAAVGNLGFPDYSINEIPEIAVFGNKPTKTKTPKGSKNNKNADADIQKQFDMAMLKAASMSDSFKAPDLSGPSEAWKAYTEAIKQESDDAAASVQNLTDAFNKLNKAENVDNTKNLAKDGKAAADSYRMAASSISMVSSALAGIDDPAAKILGIIGQAIANIALAHAEALAKDKTNKNNIWYFIATAAAMATSLAATISSLHSATGYAEGGVVQGNTYSGDQIPAMLNAGEVVLNKAMTNNLASSIQESERGGGSYKPSYISGEQIWLVLNHYTKRSGKGEIATWR